MDTYTGTQQTSCRGQKQEVEISHTVIHDVAHSAISIDLEDVRFLTPTTKIWHMWGLLIGARRCSDLGGDIFLNNKNVLSLRTMPTCNTVYNSYCNEVHYVKVGGETWGEGGRVAPPPPPPPPLPTPMTVSSPVPCSCRKFKSIMP